MMAMRSSGSAAHGGMPSAPPNAPSSKSLPPPPSSQAAPSSSAAAAAMEMGDMDDGQNYTAKVLSIMRHETPSNTRTIMKVRLLTTGIERLITADSTNSGLRIAGEIKQGDTVKLVEQGPVQMEWIKLAATEAKIRRKRKLLDIDLLLSEQGLPKLLSIAPGVAWDRREGRESKSLHALVQLYRHWLFQLHPKLSFSAALHKVESLSSKARIQRLLDDMSAGGMVSFDGEEDDGDLGMGMANAMQQQGETDGNYERKYDDADTSSANAPSSSSAAAAVGPFAAARAAAEARRAARAKQNASSAAVEAPHPDAAMEAAEPEQPYMAEEEEEAIDFYAPTRRGFEDDAPTAEEMAAKARRDEDEGEAEHKSVETQAQSPVRPEGAGQGESSSPGHMPADTAAVDAEAGVQGETAAEVEEAVEDTALEDTALETKEDALEQREEGASEHSKASAELPVEDDQAEKDALAAEKV